MTETDPYEEFDLEKAKAKAGNMYEMQMPESDCVDCSGTGITVGRLQIGQSTQEYNKYCECTIKGFK